VPVRLIPTENGTAPLFESVRFFGSLVVQTVMQLDPERYRAGCVTFGSLDEALRHLEARRLTNTSGSTAQRSRRRR